MALFGAQEADTSGAAARRPRPAPPPNKADETAERLKAIIREAATPEDALEPALRWIVEATGGAGGAVCFFDQRKELLRLAAECNLSDEGCRRLRSVRRGDVAGWDMPLHGLLNRRAYLIDSAAKNRYVPPLVEGPALVRSIVCLPLYQGNTALGSLLIVATGARMLTERDIRDLGPAIRELVTLIEAIRLRAPTVSPAAKVTSIGAGPAAAADAPRPRGAVDPDDADSPSAVLMEVIDLRTKAQELKASLASVEAAAAEHNARAAELEAKLRQSTSELGKAQAHSRTLDEQLAAARREDLPTRLAQMQARAEEQARRAADLESTLKAEQARVADLESKSAIRQQALDNLTAAATEMKTRLATTETRLAAEKTRADEAARQQEHAQSAGRDAEAATRARAAAGQQATAELQARVAALEAELAAEKARADEATREAERAQAVARESEAATRTQTSEEQQAGAAELQARLAALEGELAAEKARASAAQAELAAERARTDEAMHARAAASADDQEYAAAELAATRTLVDRLRAELAEQREQVERLEPAAHGAESLERDLRATRERETELRKRLAALEAGAATVCDAAASEPSAAAPATDAPMAAQPTPATPARAVVAAGTSEIVVIDTGGGWARVRGVRVEAPDEGIVDRIRETDGRILVNLAAPGALRALADLRAAGSTRRFWGCLATSDAARALPLGMIEPAVRPLAPEALVEVLAGYAARGTRVVTLGRDIDAFGGFRESMARQGLSVSMAWDAKQAADVLAMVKPEVAVVDLDSLREGCAIMAGLAGAQPLPHFVLLFGAKDPAPGFAHAVRDPAHASRALPLDRLVVELAKRNEGRPAERR